jgi:myosin-1
VATLSKCTPHYIRCIKPNEKKAANDFNNSLVLHQVKYLGLLENVRIRRAGYAYRQVYDKFFYRYRVVCPKTWSGWNGDMVSGTPHAFHDIPHTCVLHSSAYHRTRTRTRTTAHARRR